MTLKKIRCEINRILKMQKPIELFAVQLKKDADFDRNLKIFIMPICSN
ncbi:hypothetical protein QFZ72_000825 [Bacillus sp. V2I10]|nr:hypothetical protein [Bacillus sp. V2I10]